MIKLTPVEDDPFIVDVVCTCDECGNEVSTWQFLEGELLPITMFCVKCGKNTPCHARYKK